MIGNSYSQNSIMYVPFLFKSIAPDYSLDVGLFMLSSASLQVHLDLYAEEKTAYRSGNTDIHYKYYYCHDGEAWSDDTERSVKSVITRDGPWDLIVIQQAKLFRSQPYPTADDYFIPLAKTFINMISADLDYGTKFAWMTGHQRPTSSATSHVWTDSEIDERFDYSTAASKETMDNTDCELIIPIGTAIKNAQTLLFLKTLGDYKDNINNDSGFGYLVSDGIHLQRGLPYQLAAYTVVESLQKIIEDSLSIMNDYTLCTAEWEKGYNIPKMHGNPIGATETNCQIAKICATMAVKEPYQVTDISEYVKTIFETPFKITYILDGKEWQTDTLYYGSEIILPQVPQKDGYTFSGWSGIPDRMPPHDVVVTGEHVVNNYLVTYMVDGEVLQTDTVAYGSTIIVPAVPEKEGYTFSGWIEIPDAMPAHDVEIRGRYISVTNIVDTKYDNHIEIYLPSGLRIPRMQSGLNMFKKKDGQMVKLLKK